MFSYHVSKKIYNGLSFLKLKPGIYSKSSLIFGSFLLNLEDQMTLMKQQMQMKVLVHHGASLTTVTSTSIWNIKWGWYIDWWLNWCVKWEHKWDLNETCNWDLRTMKR